MIVLDTNVLSEAVAPKPDAMVLRWLNRQPPDSVFTTTITRAEMLYGVRLLAEGRRRSLLEAAIMAIFNQELADCVLSFDPAAADVYATIAARRRLMGRPINLLDAQIAAIAVSRGASIATRNVLDFADIGVSIINPWDDIG